MWTAGALLIAWAAWLPYPPRQRPDRSSDGRPSRFRSSARCSPQRSRSSPSSTMSRSSSAAAHGRGAGPRRGAALDESAAEAEARLSYLLCSRFSKPSMSFRKRFVSCCFGAIAERLDATTAPSAWAAMALPNASPLVGEPYWTARLPLGQAGAARGRPLRDGRADWSSRRSKAPRLAPARRRRACVALLAATERRGPSTRPSSGRSARASRPSLGAGRDSPLIRSTIPSTTRSITGSFHMTPSSLPTPPPIARIRCARVYVAGRVSYRSEDGARDREPAVRPVLTPAFGTTSVGCDADFSRRAA